MSGSLIVPDPLDPRLTTRLRGVDQNAEIDTVGVRTRRKTDYEHKISRKLLTSGCGQGTGVLRHDGEVRSRRP